MKKYLSILAIVFLITGCGKGEKSGNAPASFILVSPQNNQPCTTGTVTSATQSSINFSWNASTGADSYDLTLTNLLTNTNTTQTVTKASATVTLLQNTPYSWYVTAKSSNTTATTKSDVWKFYNSGSGIITYPPFPAELVTPAFGATVTSTNGTINLTWTGSSVSNNIKSYYVYFGTTASPGLLKAGVTDMFLNGITVSPKTTYYWTIATVDANQNVSYSVTGNFYVTQ